MKKLIEKKERNLLIYSNYISKIPKLSVLLNLLHTNEALDPNSSGLTNELSQLIVTNKSLWLDMSRSEWKLRKELPLITNKSLDRKKWKKCSLCYTPNKHEYYIVNKLSGTIINVGGECVKSFLGDEIGSISTHVLKNPKAAILYEKLQSEFPIIKDILFNDKTYLSQSEYILPSLLSEKFEKKRKRISKILNNYLNKKVESLDRDLFYIELKEYVNIKKEIEDFKLKSRKEIWSCPLSLAREIKVIQKENYPKIINSIERNNGRISFSIAPMIQVESFLKLFMEEFNQLNFDKIKITGYSIGRITFNYIDSNNILSFTISSADFINFFAKEVFSIRSVNIETFTRENYYKFTPENSITTRLLEQTSEIYLETEYEFREFEINYKAVFRTETETDYKYEDRIEKLENLIKNIVVYHRFGDNKVYVFDRKDLSNSGIQLEFDPNRGNTIAKNLISKANILTQSKFYEYLRTNVYNSKIQNL
ncbi:hypothetical protein GUJ44_13215 [Enterococcus faecalis]|uniref:hypothetical protein n=1 Tax=Enterococcus faecalis TaxID=1351 RepID=UPI001367FD2B|nr:hypothetical protein [Enterococcus faecalis]NAA43529.1 hypothetical protein [Enterococcus faecalis]NAA62428.1 hypothetical protein [Enterococcus faecalis]NAB66304.1 hypothetical protein [Enterococcus faecalis]NAB85996.1 hypothetical protein [Enterococcus faecalis]NAB89008.1 hypothetical protein [Enterococcus faecalis]